MKVVKKDFYSMVILISKNVAKTAYKIIIIDILNCVITTFQHSKNVLNHMKFFFNCFEDICKTLKLLYIPTLVIVSDMMSNLQRLIFLVDAL